MQVSFEALDSGIVINDDGETWSPSEDGESTLITLGAFQEMIDFDKGLETYIIHIYTGKGKKEPYKWNRYC